MMPMLTTSMVCFTLTKYIKPLFNLMYTLLNQMKNKCLLPKLVLCMILRQFSKRTTLVSFFLLQMRFSFLVSFKSVCFFLLKMLAPFWLVIITYTISELSQMLEVVYLYFQLSRKLILPQKAFKITKRFLISSLKLFS